MEDLELREKIKESGQKLNEIVLTMQGILLELDLKLSGEKLDKFAGILAFSLYLDGHEFKIQESDLCIVPAVPISKRIKQLKFAQENHLTAISNSELKQLKQYLRTMSQIHKEGLIDSTKVSPKHKKLFQTIRRKPEIIYGGGATNSEMSYMMALASTHTKKLF